MAINKLEQMGENVTILVDRDIKELSSRRKLLISENYEENQVRYASYELRVSNKVSYIASQSNGCIGKSIDEINDRSYIEIFPNQTLHLYTYEKISLPENVLARVTVSGQIFSSGLFAENTFADPGFGLSKPSDLYISVTNTTAKIINIPIHYKLARIEFYRIGDGVENSFRGQTSENLLKYKNAYKDSIDSLTSDNQQVLFKDFSDRLLRFEDEDRCIRHFSIIKKSMNEDQDKMLNLKQNNIKLTNTTTIMGLLIYILIAFDIAVTAHYFYPDDYNLLKLTPFALVFISQILIKDFRKKWLQLFSKESNI